MVCHKSLQIIFLGIYKSANNYMFQFFQKEKKHPRYLSSVEKCSCLKHIIFYGEERRVGERIPKGRCIMLLGHLTAKCAFPHFTSSCVWGCVKYYTCTQCSFFLCSFNQSSLLLLDVWRMCALPSSTIGTQQGVQLNLSGEQTRGKTNSHAHNRFTVYTSSI